MQHCRERRGLTLSWQLLQQEVRGQGTAGDQGTAGTAGDQEGLGGCQTNTPQPAASEILTRGTWLDSPVGSLSVNNIWSHFSRKSAVILSGHFTVCFCYTWTAQCTLSLLQLSFVKKNKENISCCIRLSLEILIFKKEMSNAPLQCLYSVNWKLKYFFA